MQTLRSVPEQGQLAVVRQRRYVVTDVRSGMSGACRASSGSRLYPGSLCAAGAPWCSWRATWALSGLGRMSRLPRPPRAPQPVAGHGTYSGAAVAAKLKRPIAVVGYLARHQDRSGHRFAFFALVRAGVGIRMGRKIQVLPACTDVFPSAGGGYVHHGVLERLIAGIPGRNKGKLRRILRKGTRRLP